METQASGELHGHANGAVTTGRVNITVMGKKSNLPSYKEEGQGSRPREDSSRQQQGKAERCSGKATGGGYKNPQRADNSNSSSQHARSTAKGDQQSKGWEAPKRVSSSKGQGTCIPRAKADRNKPAAPLHLQKGVEAPAAPGPMQQQVAKQEPESKLDAACTQESLTMPPLSLASPSHMERTTLPMQLQPHQAYQPLPGSPAKRGPSEYSSIGGLSEKRSRARGPSKEEEQVGVPSGPAHEETCPAKSGRPSSTSPSGKPSGAALHVQGGSSEHIQGSRGPQSPRTPEVGLGVPNHPDFLATEEGKGAEHHRRVPRLNLNQLPSWAAHESAGRPPCLYRPVSHAAPGSTPSPEQPEQQGGLEVGSEDEELASWMHEPQWVPDSEGKGHVFKPVSRKELRQYEALISELQPHQAQQVTQLWESLHEARQSCEQMTSRGVRAAKDVTAGWAAHVSDLVDRSERFEKQVRELMLLTQHQADAIEALQLELASTRVSRASSLGVTHEGSPPAAGAPARQAHATPCSRSGSPGKGSDEDGRGGVEGSSIGGRGGQQEWSDGVARVMRQELQASALENAKLASTNAELVQSLDSMNLLFSGAQAEVAQLSKQLARSQEQSASLERQLEALRKQQRFEQHHGTTHHRYSQPAGPHASRPFVAQAFCAAGRASDSASRGPEQLHRHTASYMNHTSFRSSFGPDHVGLRSTVLGNEHKRAAFRAMLNRGGVV